METNPAATQFGAPDIVVAVLLLFVIGMVALYGYRQNRKK